MKTIEDFEEYKILDLADGRKLESWNGIILNRPDPEIIWPSVNGENWNSAVAKYERSNKGGGHWECSSHVPYSWEIHYRDLTFN